MSASPPFLPSRTLLGVGLQTRLRRRHRGGRAARGGGSSRYRAIAALGDAYRWTARPRPRTLARGFAQSLTSRDLHEPRRACRPAPQRLSGVHPDLLGVAVLARDRATRRPRRATRRAAARRRHASPRSSTPAAAPVARARARASASTSAPRRVAAGRREVLLAGVGGALLLLIGVSALGAGCSSRPSSALSRSALLVAAGKPGPAAALAPPRRARRRSPARWTRSAARCSALQARIDGLDRQDPLTGALNHRGLHDALHEALDGAATRGEKVAVVVLDIDHFESLNDRARPRGRRRGAARSSPASLLGELRPGDVCGRIGGDEFLLALRDSDAWGAERVVERLRSAVAAAPLCDGRCRASPSAPASPSSPATPATRSGSCGSPRARSTAPSARAATAASSTPRSSTRRSRSRRRPSAPAPPASPTRSTRSPARSTSRTATRTSTPPAWRSTPPCSPARWACRRRRSTRSGPRASCTTSARSAWPTRCC